jgi:ABC-type sugar transport system ATPase subunit
VTATVPELVLSDQPLLEVRGLIKDFPGQRALDSVDFDVLPGEIHALLGENGAGKSTLIKCIAGAQPIDGGEILVDGEVVELRTVGDARDLGISVIHQQGNLVADLSIVDNMAVGRGIDGRTRIIHPRRERQAVALLLERVGLTIDPDTVVADLRPHESAMVSVAKALHANARLVILDEPTTALSAEEIDILFDQVRELASKGVSFVYVSHRLGEVFRLADRITVLRNGRKIQTWDYAEGHEQEIIDALVSTGKLRHPEVLESYARDTIALEIRDLATGPCEGVSFTVHDGEVLGLAGLAGAGADDVASSLTGNPPARAGSITIRGAEVTPRSPRAAIEAGVAAVPKDRHRQALLPGFSILENVTLPTTRSFITDPVTRWLRRGKEKAAAQSVIDMLSVKATGPDQSVSTLSGGNQQKVVIGRWLLESYPLYVYIDPCAGVDIGSKAEIYSIIRDRAKDGAGVVFTSSEAEEYERVCDRVLVFHHGRIVAELTGSQIHESNIVRHSVTPTEDELRHPEADA